MDDQNKLLCKNCKHSFVPLDQMILAWGMPSEYQYKCRKTYVEIATDYSLVTGPKVVNKKYDGCGVTRLSGGICGPQGKLWDPKRKKDLFLAITRGKV